MAEGETWRLDGATTSPKSAGALSEDNKRLQEMLQSALRREAEALRRVRHLSELLAECRMAGSRTPSSGPDAADGMVAEGQWRMMDWESSDLGSAPHSQSSEPVNLSPSLVVSPPLASAADDSFVFPGVMSAPAPLTALHRQEALALSTPELTSTSPAPDDHSFPHPLSPEEASAPAALLAPALRTSGDVRRERERPPQSRRSSSPQAPPLTG
jgi:hypothetical protein